MSNRDDGAFLSQEQREAKKYLDGALAAYEDCASICSHIGTRNLGFAKFATDRGQDPSQARLMADTGSAMAKMLADAIREKAKSLTGMIETPPGRH